MAARSRWRDILATPSAALCLVLAAGFVFLALFAGLIWGHDANATNVAISNQGPSRGHWLGTDPLGRDVLARTLVATRSSLGLAFLATATGAVIGVGLGMLSAVGGHRFRVLLASLINLLLAFPALLLAIVFVVILGVGSVPSIIAVGVSFSPGFARLTQTLAASIADREFILAARQLGRSPFYIIRRHLLPNVAEPILLYGTVHIGQAILALAGLSFLGLGVQLPAYDWGSLLQEGLSQLYATPLLAVAPAAIIVVAGVTCNLAGELLSDLIAKRTAVERRLAVADSGSVRSWAPASGSDASALPPDQEPVLLRVRNLSIRFPTRAGVATPVRDVSFDIRMGERVGIVGESGSGKSLTALAIATLIQDPGRVTAGELELLGTNLLGKSDEVSKVVGKNLGLIFQDPGGTLNPAVRIGTHLREPAQIHLGLSRRAAKERAIEALRSVAIPNPERCYRQHQHELSGGMKQRVSIAMGLMAEPRLLIADEPTTALDVSVQRQVLQLLMKAGGEAGAGVLLISHDIAVVSEVCDRVVVMYAGFVMEEAPTDVLLASPAHPYTGVLLAASPDMSMDVDRSLPVVDGRVPGPEDVLPGCYFAPRCARATERCRLERPPLQPLPLNGRAPLRVLQGDRREMAPSQRVACWHPLHSAEVPETWRAGDPRAKAL